MRETTIKELASEIKNAAYPVFVCGAGISYGAAPLAQDLEDGLLASVAAIAGLDKTSMQVSDIVNSAIEVREDYLTLELLTSFIAYRVPALKEVLLDLWENIFHLKEVNGSNRAIASALETGSIASLLTSNFDDGLFRGISDTSKFRAITDRNVADKLSEKGDICAFHGTVFKPTSDGAEQLSPPTSMTARELAHPFIPNMARYITDTFEKADQIFLVGYRGEDFYDFNLELDKYLKSSKNEEDRLFRLQKFHCIPHMGDINGVSDFITNTFLDSHIINLSNGSHNWLIDLCDELTKYNTPVSSTTTEVNARYIENFIVGAVKALRISDTDLYERTKSQSQSLLDDINSGVLAFWSVAEHYRLESLGLSQNEIAAFGRPPQNRKLCELSLQNVIDLQKKYWKFNSNDREISKDENGELIILAHGHEIYGELEKFATDSINSAASAERKIDQACCHVLAAISLDYMGLIAMKLESRISNVPRQFAEVRLIPRAEDLFIQSKKQAVNAGKVLETEPCLIALSGSTKDEYNNVLETITGWQLWSIIPFENYARCFRGSLSDRLELFQEVIDARMKKIRGEVGKRDTDIDNVDFSVSGHASQCALRCVEAARILANTNEKGKPDFSIADQDKDVETLDWLEYLVDISSDCLDAASRYSSQKNRRFAAVYDTKVLLHLYNGDVNKARDVYEEAKKYAEGSIEIENWVANIESRF